MQTQRARLRQLCRAMRPSRRRRRHIGSRRRYETLSPHAAPRARWICGGREGDEDSFRYVCRSPRCVGLCTHYTGTVDGVRGVFPAHARTDLNTVATTESDYQEVANVSQTYHRPIDCANRGSGSSQRRRLPTPQRRSRRRGEMSWYSRGQPAKAWPLAGGQASRPPNRRVLRVPQTPRYSRATPLRRLQQPATRKSVTQPWRRYANSNRDRWRRRNSRMLWTSAVRVLTFLRVLLMLRSSSPFLART